MTNISGEFPKLNDPSSISSPSKSDDFFDVAGLKANDLNALTLTQVAVEVLKDGIGNDDGNRSSESLKGRLASLEKLEGKLRRSEEQYAKETAGVKGFFKGIGDFFRGTLLTRRYEYDNLVRFHRDVSELITSIKASQPSINKEEPESRSSSLKGRASQLTIEIPENDGESNQGETFPEGGSPRGVADLTTPREISEIFQRVAPDNNDITPLSVTSDSSEVEESEPHGFSFSFFGSAWSGLTSRIAEVGENLINTYNYVFDHDALLDEYAGQRAEGKEVSPSTPLPTDGEIEGGAVAAVKEERKGETLSPSSVTIIGSKKISEGATSSIESKGSPVGVAEGIEGEQTISRLGGFDPAGKSTSDFYPLMKNQDLAGLQEIKGLIKLKQQEIRDEQSLLEKGDLYFEKSKAKEELLKEQRVLSDKLALLSTGESVVEMELTIEGKPVTVPLFSDEAIEAYNAKLKELGNSKLEKGLSISLISSLLATRLSEINNEMTTIQKEMDELIQDEKVSDLIQAKNQGRIQQELATCKETLAQWISLEGSCNNKISNLKKASALKENEAVASDSAEVRVTDEDIAQVIPEWGAVQELRGKADQGILIGLRNPRKQFIDVLNPRAAGSEKLKEKANLSPSSVKVEIKEEEISEIAPPRMNSLFGQIKGGVALRKAGASEGEEVQSSPKTETPSPRPGMGGLLGAIQNGKKLKKASPPSTGIDGSAPAEEGAPTEKKEGLGMLFKPRREVLKEEAKPAVVLTGEPAVHSNWQILDKEIGKKTVETLKAEREEIIAYRQELEEVLAPVVKLQNTFIQQQEALTESLSKSKKLDEQIASLKEKQKLLTSGQDVVWMEIPVRDKEKIPVAIFSDSKFKEYNDELRKMGSKELLPSGMRQSALLDVISEELDSLKVDKEMEDEDIKRLEKEVMKTKGESQRGIPFNSELYKQIIEDKTALLDKWGRALKNYDRQLVNGASEAASTSPSEEVEVSKQELRNIEGFDQLDAIRKLREEVAKDKTAPLNLAKPGAEWFKRLKQKS